MVKQATANPQGSIALIGSDPKTVGNLLSMIAPALQRVLPRELPVAKLAQVAFTELRRTPKLAECTQVSFLACVYKSALCGMYPDLRGRVWYIPRRTGPKDPNTGQKALEANFQMGYQGLLDLARRSAQVEKIEARVVREGDLFAYEYGTEPFIQHRPNREKSDGQLVASYSVAWLKGARFPQFEVCEAEYIDRIKQFAQVSTDPKDAWRSPWTGPFEDSMWRKAAVAKLCKLLPASEEVQRAIAMEEEGYSGQPQQLPHELGDIGIGRAGDEGMVSVDDLLGKLQAEPPPAAEPPIQNDPFTSQPAMK